MKNATLLETHIEVSDINLANQIISKMNKTHFEQLDQLTALRARVAELENVLRLIAKNEFSTDQAMTIAAEALK